MPVLDQQVLKDDREALALLDAILGARRQPPVRKPQAAACAEAGAKLPALC